MSELFDYGVGIGAALKTASQYLNQHSDTPTLDAELLLIHILKVSRTYLIIHPEQQLSAEQRQQFVNFLRRRQQGEPVAYITGHQGFWSLDLQVSKDTLIPRPETELLIELALQQLPQNSAIKVADLGTGSGAIALALASERPAWQIYATDTSTAALKIAQQNALNLALSRIRFFQGDWFDALPSHDFTAIISNPPYLAENDPHLHASGLPFEPISALTAPEAGLKAIRELIEQAQAYLLPGGWIMLEHGYNQMEVVQELFRKNAYTDIHSQKDLNGQWRCSIARKPRQE